MSAFSRVFIVWVATLTACLPAVWAEAPRVKTEAPQPPGNFDSKQFNTRQAAAEARVADKNLAEKADTSAMRLSNTGWQRPVFIPPPPPSRPQNNMEGVWAIQRLLAFFEAIKKMGERSANWCGTGSNYWKNQPIEHNGVILDGIRSLPTTEKPETPISD